jgi:hypothetical protein
MDRVAARHGIGDDVVAHFGGHGRKAFGQRRVQRKRLSSCLADQFGEKPVEDRITCGLFGTWHGRYRNNVRALNLKRGRCGQRIPGPELGKDQTVRGRQPTLASRQIETFVDSIEQGLSPGLAVLPRNAGGIETCAKQVEKVFVRRRRRFDGAETRDDLTPEGGALQKIDADPIQNVATRTELIAASPRERGQGLINPTFRHLSPVPVARLLHAA